MFVVTVITCDLARAYYVGVDSGNLEGSLLLISKSCVYFSCLGVSVFLYWQIFSLEKVSTRSG